MKKAKGEGKAPKLATPSAKQDTTIAAVKSVPKAERPVDIVEARENINRLVRGSAKDIATKMIEVAKDTGQLALAKYLFEVGGLYPPREQTAGQPKEDSLAEILLRRLGLPVGPVEEDRIAAGLADDEKSTPGQSISTAGGDGVVERYEEQQLSQDESTRRPERGMIP
jgi:hypothetical protein